MKRATYYYCVKERPDKYASLRAEITRVFEENKGRYGYRRVCLQLRGNGLTINHKTVARLMAEMNLHAYRRKLRYHSYKGEVGRIAPMKQTLLIVSGQRMSHKWIYKVRNATCLLY